MAAVRMAAEHMARERISWQGTALEHIELQQEVLHMVPWCCLLASFPQPEMAMQLCRRTNPEMEHRPNMRKRDRPRKV